MIGYCTPNISQMRVCNADLGFAGFRAAGAGMLLTRGGGMLLRALVFAGLAFTALAFVLGAVDFRFFAAALGAFDLGETDLDGAFGARLVFALGATDLRFLAGAFVVLF
jgi:hypothetical protein